MTWVPFSRKTFIEKALKRKPSFAFASNQILVPIMIQELRYVTGIMPLLFGANEQDIEMFGVMGLKNGPNAFVDADGNWLHGHIPFWLRLYPFALGESDKGDSPLFINDGSDRVVARNDGDPFFNEDGTNGPVLEHFIHTLRAAKQFRENTRDACSLIKDFGLLEPFEDGRYQLDGKNLKINGLFSVRETVFRELEENKYLELKNKNAIDLIYAQLFSQDKFDFLFHFFNMQQRKMSPMRKIGEDIFSETESALDFKFAE